MTIAIIIASVSAIAAIAAIAEIRNRAILRAESKRAAQMHVVEIAPAREESKPTVQDRKAAAAHMQYLRNEAQRLGVTVVHYAK